MSVLNIKYSFEPTPSVAKICLQPMAAAVRISVPALPGSFKLSKMRVMGRVVSGGRTASPWFGFLNTPAKDFSYIKCQNLSTLREQDLSL